MINILKRILNRILGFIDLQLIKIIGKTTAYTPVFITGNPRSGTTILFQYLVDKLDTCYFSNVDRRNYRYPFLSNVFNKSSLKYFPTSASNFGMIAGKHAPSDAWEIFHTWFSYFGNPNKSDYANFKSMRYLFNAVSNYYNKPLIVKNNANTLRLFELLTEFPNAEFIHLERSIYENVYSILNGRKKNNINPGEFWSSAPEKDILSLEFKSELDLIVFQYLFNNEYVKRVNSSGRITIIRYEDFCDTPEIALKTLTSYHSRGHNNLIDIKKSRQEFDDKFILQVKESRQELEPLVIEEVNMFIGKYHS